MMNRHTKPFLFFIFLLTLGGFAYGQSIGKDSPVERKYDKFKDETELSTSIGPFFVKSTSPEYVLGIYLLTTFKGEKVPATAKYMLRFLTSSDNWQFLKGDRTLYAIVDGKRMTLGVMNRVDSAVNKGTTNEMLLMPITLKTMEFLANAKTIELKCNITEVELVPADIAQIRKFLEAVRPVKTSPAKPAGKKP